MNLHEILVQPVRKSEEPRHQELMQEHHYLGSLPKIGETLRYVVVWREQWIALLSFSAYRAANWFYVGNTKGFRRTHRGYSAKDQAPKMVFVKPLQPDAQAVLSRAILKPPYRTGGCKMMLKAAQMESLPDFFADIPDPRRAQGRRHRLKTIV